MKKISKDTEVEPEDIVVYEAVIDIINARYALVPVKLVKPFPKYWFHFQIESSKQSSGKEVP